MSGQSAIINAGKHLSNPAAVRSRGLLRALPLLLFADGLMLATALVLWSLKGSQPQTMAALSSLSFMSLAVIIWFAAQYATDLNCQAFLILQAAWGYWYLLPMWITGLRGQILLDQEVHDFTPGQVAQSCVAVLLVKFAATLVYQLVNARPVLNVERISSSLNRRSYRMPIFPVAALLGLGMVPFVFSGTPIWTAILGSRSAGGVFPTTNFGGTGTKWFGFTLFLTACCLLAFYEFLLRRQSISKWIFFLLGCASLTVFALAVSTRTMLIASVMPILTFYLLGSPDRWRLPKVLVCIIGLWMAADVLASTRMQGFLQKGPQEKLSRNLIDNDFFVELLFVISTVPDQVPYDYQDPVIYLPISLIPRSLWHGKPISATGERVIRMRSNVFNTELSGNMLPGIVGQYWEVAGWIGLVVLGVWLGITFAVSDSIIYWCNWNIRYIALAFTWAAFISFRTFALSNLLPAIFCAALILLFSQREQEFAAAPVGRG